MCYLFVSCIVCYTSQIYASSFFYPNAPKIPTAHLSTYFTYECYVVYHICPSRSLALIVTWYVFSLCHFFLGDEANHKWHLVLLQISLCKKHWIKKTFPVVVSNIISFNKNINLILIYICDKFMVKEGVRILLILISIDL